MTGTRPLRARESWRKRIIKTSPGLASNESSQRSQILPVYLCCLISIFTPPRLFSRVSVIKLTNLSIVLGIHQTSDWLPTLSLVFWLAEDDPAVILSASVVGVGSVIPLYNWSISVCFVPIWPLPLWRDDSLSYDMIPQGGHWAWSSVT